MRRKVFGIVKRATAVLFTWSAFGLGLYGICTLRVDLLVFAVFWFFMGAFALMIVRQIEESVEDGIWEDRP